MVCLVKVGNALFQPAPGRPACPPPPPPLPPAPPPPARPPLGEAPPLDETSPPDPPPEPPAITPPAPATPVEGPPVPPVVAPPVPAADPPLPELAGAPLPPLSVWLPSAGFAPLEQPIAKAVENNAMRRPSARQNQGSGHMGGYVYTSSLGSLADTPLPDRACGPIGGSRSQSVRDRKPFQACHAPDPPSPTGAGNLRTHETIRAGTEDGRHVFRSRPRGLRR
jgi:hypothetical protein